MIAMENDNLTELVSKWKETEGVEDSELSAISLYNQLVAESRVEGPVSESYSQTATELIQMIQGWRYKSRNIWWFIKRKLCCLIFDA